jgi:hypothetical protein
MSILLSSIPFKSNDIEVTISLDNATFEQWFPLHAGTYNLTLAWIYEEQTLDECYIEVTVTDKLSEIRISFLL